MTVLLALPPRISAEDAVRFFERPRLANLYGLTTRPVRIASADVPSSRTPPFVERLWLPSYAIRFRTTARGVSTSIWTAVDATAGQFSLLECENELSSLDVDEDAFPPTLEEADAVAAARRGLLQYVLRRRGQLDKPVVEEVEEIKLHHFPLWVLYYRRGLKSLDIKVLDGYTGRSTGPKMRVAVVNALVAARKSRASRDS